IGVIKLFEKYDEKTQRRIYSLLSREIDSNVKAGITKPEKIVEYFIKEIRKKDMDTWKSLRKYIDSTYFYKECIRYVESKIDEYIDRYGGYSQKGNVTEGQAKYLASLIEKTLKHEDYRTRMDGLDELRSLIKLISKSGASKYIDKYKTVLGWNDKENKAKK
ncbi:MAG TPA: hypothetical protein VJ962_03725, partial [Clostridia bacterium]|nr:hypothetical protein [Clostridia bacterium]